MTSVGRASVRLRCRIGCAATPAYVTATPLNPRAVLPSALRNPASMRMPASSRRLGPLGLEVLGRRDHGDRADHLALQQIRGHPQREGGLAGARGRDREEVLADIAVIGVQGRLLPGPQAVRGPPRRPVRERRRQVLGATHDAPDHGSEQRRAGWTDRSTRPGSAAPRRRRPPPGRPPTAAPPRPHPPQCRPHPWAPPPPPGTPEGHRAGRSPRASPGGCPRTPMPRPRPGPARGPGRGRSRPRRRPARSPRRRWRTSARWPGPPRDRSRRRRRPVRPRRASPSPGSRTHPLPGRGPPSWPRRAGGRPRRRRTAPGRRRRGAATPTPRPGPRSARAPAG